MDPDVVEILPPVTSNTPNSMKPTEAIRHDLIDLDNDDDNDCADLVIGDKVGKIDKGKAIATIHDDYGDYQNVELFDDVTDKSGSGDGHNADSSCDDDYSDLFLDDYTDVDQYALIQRHFDNVDIPPGIEVPIPWLAEYDIGSKNINNDSLSPWSHTMSGGYNSQVTGSSQSSLTLEPTNLETQASSAASHVFVDNFETKKLPNVSEVLYWGHFGNSKTANGGNTLYHSNFVGFSFHFPRAGFNNDMWSKKAFYFQQVPSYTSFVKSVVPLFLFMLLPSHCLITPGFMIVCEMKIMEQLPIVLLQQYPKKPEMKF